jgi:hypothetical protein
VRPLFAVLTLLATISLFDIVSRPGTSVGQFLAGFGAGACATLFVHLILAEARSERKRGVR